MQCTAHNAIAHNDIYMQFTNRHAVNCTTVLDTQKHSSSNICTEQEFTTVSQTTRRWNIKNPIFWGNLDVLQCNAMQCKAVEYDAMQWNAMKGNEMQ